MIKIVFIFLFLCVSGSAWASSCGSLLTDLKNAAEKLVASKCESTNDLKTLDQVNLKITDKVHEGGVIDHKNKTMQIKNKECYDLYNLEGVSLIRVGIYEAGENNKAACLQKIKEGLMKFPSKTDSGI